jgi:6-phosphofructokinase
VTSIRCIGICTGGGDAPGLNAVIRAAVKAAFLKYKWKVIGIPDGFDGLIWPQKSYELTLKDVSGILPRGGTILGTTNRGNPIRYYRIMVVEVMGRDAGWIALEAGIAGGAHVILIPEIPFTIENICTFVARRESYGKRFTIVVVAEGIKLPPELKENRRAGAVGNVIGNAIAASAKKEVRVSVLAHIQRGGLTHAVRLHSGDADSRNDEKLAASHGT